MAFGDITNGLATFLAQHRFAEELCVFLHVPKTAGSSLSHELARLREPYINIHRRYFHGEAVSFSRVEDELGAAIDRGKIDTARSCSGHFTWAMAASLRWARPDARFFTFLRDPVARVISDYRYSRTPSHPTHREMIAKFPSIESYLKAPETQNKMSRFLLPDEAVSPVEIDAFVSRHYAFIGLLEDYAMSFNILARMLGEDAMPSEHKRVTEDTEDNIVDITPELREQVAQVNQRDVALHDIARAKLDAVAGEWQALRAAAAAP